jgi:hypothetical protein
VLQEILIFFFGRSVRAILIPCLNVFFCHAFNLECEIKETSARSYFSTVRSGKECDVTNLVLTSPNQQITSVNGISGSNAIRNDVTGFYVQLQTMNYFPRGIEKFFPNIEAIYVQSCKLKAIKKEDLEKFTQLKELILHYNEIEELYDDLFVSNEKLLYIDLGHNKIKFIGEKTFESLKNLHILYLSSNQCINKYAAYSVNRVREIINEAKSSCQNEITYLK